MKRKEIKRLAEKIAAQEKIIREAPDQETRARAEAEITKLSGMVDNLDTMFALDELILEILEKNS